MTLTGEYFNPADLLRQAELRVHPALREAGRLFVTIDLELQAEVTDTAGGFGGDYFWRRPGIRAAAAAGPARAGPPAAHPTARQPRGDGQAGVAVPALPSNKTL